jgi:hypothetical protein
MAGCAAMGTDYAQAPQPQANQALVYIYRVDTYALGGRDAYFYVDGTNVADLSRNGYTWFHAPSGKHVLQQKWPIDVSMFKKLEIPANWEPGKAYYYKFVAFGGDSLPGTITIRWRLSEVSESQAQQELKDTKLQPSFGSAKLNQSSATQ